MKSAGLLITSVLVATVNAACGSSTPTTSTPSQGAGSFTNTVGTPNTTTTAAATTDTGPFNSCSVVTQAEAASALGASVTAGVLGNATVEGGKACVFYGAAAPSPRDANVAEADSVRVVVVEGGDALKWYNDYKSKVSPRVISGFGDQAFYDGIASFNVLKGGAYMRIAVVPVGAAPSLAAEEKLATAILPSL